MTLTTAAKDYIANHFGAGTPKCFVSSGISYTDPAGTAQVGSTQDVVSTLKFDPFGTGLQRGPNGEQYPDIPDHASIDDNDITWIGNSQSGAAQYCVGVTCTPGTKRCRDSKTVEQCRGDGSGWDVVQTCGAGYECRAGACVPVTVGDLEGFVGTFDFGKVCVGDPEGSIDVSTVTMGQEYNPTAGKSVFWLSHSKVANTGTAAAGTDCPMWIALELRLWAGTHVECGPTGIPDAWKGVNINTDEGWMIIFPIDAGTTEEIYAHFYVPDSIKGIHTLCLYVWANFSKSALYDELEVAGYTNPP